MSEREGRYEGEGEGNDGLLPGQEADSSGTGAGNDDAFHASEFEGWFASTLLTLFGWDE